MSPTQIYDARTGTYIRGGSASADPGGNTIYNFDSDLNASSIRRDSSGRAVSLPLQDALSQAVGQNLDGTYVQVNNGTDYSPLADSLLQFGSNFGEGSIFDANSLFEKQMALAERNSALSQEMADRANAFNAEQADIARSWSAEQAKNQRDWQNAMANSAHQREVSDLLSAGLNPILSANAGAATPSGGIPSASNASGHAGQVDTTSAINAVSSLLGTQLNAATQLASIENQRQMQDKQIAADLVHLEQQGEISRDVAELNKQAAAISSGTNASALRYGYDLNQENIQRGQDLDYDIALRNINNQRFLQSQGFENEKSLQYLGYAYDRDLQNDRLRNDIFINTMNNSEALKRVYAQNESAGNINASRNATQLLGDSMRLTGSLALGRVFGSAYTSRAYKGTYMGFH